MVTNIAKKLPSIDQYVRLFRFWSHQSRWSICEKHITRPPSLLHSSNIKLWSVFFFFISLFFSKTEIKMIFLKKKNTLEVYFFIMGGGKLSGKVLVSTCNYVLNDSIKIKWVFSQIWHKFSRWIPIMPDFKRILNIDSQEKLMLAHY